LPFKDSRIAMVCLFPSFMLNSCSKTFKHLP